jgi:hypothetical protein
MFRKESSLKINDRCLRVQEHAVIVKHHILTPVSTFKLSNSFSLKFSITESLPCHRRFADDWIVILILWKTTN